ncbi:MAG: patatin-like phospholipase family protein [Candidatus Melainabacteria bacterium]|nr:patatin-like phospholipase family protein [Candidatus Melainabacteria bacterium]
MYSRHLIIEQGGTRALVTGMGATLALKVAGLKSWSTIGGISGGSIPAILMASKLNPLSSLERILACDFSQLFQPSAKVGTDPAAAHAARREGERVPAHKWVARMLRKGMMHTDKLGELIEKEVKVWPESFWTMASSETSHVVFTASGVFEYGFDGSFTVLSEEPASISLAIRATCAVPGLLEAVEYRGRYLFDGALSPYGDNPVAFARKHLLGEEGLVVSCFSTGKDSRKNDMLMNLGRWLLCHSAGKVTTGDRKADININSHVPQLTALRFKMTEAQKQLGMLAGFNAAIMALAKHSHMFQEGVSDLPCATDFAMVLQLARQYLS